MVQSGYLLVKGLIKNKSNNMQFFNALDELFDIPKPKEKPMKTEEELLAELKNVQWGGSEA